MNDDPKTVTRRNMLAKLGLAAGAAYAAPMLLPLSEARASSISKPSKPSGPSLGRRRRRRRNFSSFSRD